MRKIFLMTFVVFMTMNGCKAGEKNQDWAAATDKETVRETRSVKDFTAIKLIGPYDVVYRQGSKQKVEVEARRDAIDRLATEVHDSTLVIKTNKNVGVKIAGVTVINNTGGITVYVTSPRLTEVTLIGSGDIVSHEPLKAERLRLCMQGSGDILFKDCEVETLRANLYGSGDLQLSNVKAGLAEVSLRGSGDLRAHFKECNVLRTLLQGSGDLTVSGKADIYNSRKTGSGDMHDANLSYLMREGRNGRNGNAAGAASVKSPNGIVAEP